MLIKQGKTTVGIIDDDTLEFTASGQSNIHIKIIQTNGTITLTPTANWFGTEQITFYANDSVNITSETVRMLVKPQNDPPVLVQVDVQYTKPGYPEMEFFVNEDDWLNLTFVVEDVDEDVARNKIVYQMIQKNLHNVLMITLK